MPADVQVEGGREPDDAVAAAIVDDQRVVQPQTRAIIRQYGERPISPLRDEDVASELQRTKIGRASM